MRKILALLTLMLMCIGGWAEDSFTWKNSSTAITAQSWAVADNWTLSGSTTFPTGGPAITGDHAWDKMYFTSASGTTPNLEGWAFKIEMDNSTITIPNIKKLQGTCSITLKNGSTLNMTKAVTESGNDGQLVAIDLATGDANEFNLIMGNNKGGDLTTVNYGTVTTTTNRKFNISSNNTDSRTYNSLKVVATITDEVESTSEPTLHSVELGTLTNATITTLTSEITATGFVKTTGVLTATDENVGLYSVDASNGKIMLYWVTGTLAGGDIIVADGESKSFTELVTEYGGLPQSITVKTGGTLDLDGAYGLGKVTTEDGSTLILSTAADISAITGATNVVVNTDCTINGNKSTAATGKLTINAGKQLTIGSGDGQNNSVASFTSVLVNGTIYGNNCTTTLQNVTFGNGGVLHSFDMGAPGSNAANGTYDNSFHLTGTTTVNGEAYILSKWNAQYKIDKLVGSGTLKFRGNGKTNEGADEATYYTFSDTQEFTGSFDILNTNARFTNVLEGINVTNGIKVNTISLKDITLVGTQRINTQGVVTIDGVVANNITSSSYGYALVQGGNTTLNLKGNIDFTLNSNGETNSHSKLGYQTASTINILEGANVKCGGVWHSSNTDCAPINIAANATLVSTDKVWSNSINNNGHIKIEVNSLGSDSYINTATITGDNFDVIFTNDALGALAEGDYTVVSCSSDNAAANVTVNNESEFTLDACTYTVTKDGSNIKLTKALPMSEKIAALQAKCEQAYAAAILIDELGVRGKVGYPQRSAQTSRDLFFYSGTMEGCMVTEQNFEFAKQALEAYYRETDIVLPQDGKAYTIKAVYSGGEDMLYYDETTGKIKGSATQPTKGHIFVCKKTADGKFLFVNDYGKYLTWGSSSSISDNASAVVDEYSQYADVTVTKATARTNGTGTDVDDEGRFGLVTLQAFRAKTEDLWYSNYIHGHATNNFVEDYASSKWYDGAGNRTHMYRIEEVEYPYNKPNLQFDKDAVSGPTYASIYLPFAMTIPAGVKAYAATGTKEEDGKNLVTLKLVADGTANTNIHAGAYILYSETKNGAQTIIPAAANPDADGENLLQGSTLADATLPAEVTIWVLGKKSGMGFYKYTGSTYPLGKALFVDENASEGSPKFEFLFSDDDLTAIKEAIKEADANVQLRDLWGNPIVNPIKGQIYIKNGKAMKY